MILSFVKMHGAGNDFVLTQTADDAAPLSEWARRLCDRRTGIGADGLLVAGPSSVAATRYRMFNPDGSEAESCGNGLRCFAVWAMSGGVLPPEGGAVETARGVLALRPWPGGASVEMGPFAIGGDFEGGVVVGVGNPHVVFEVDDIFAVDVRVEGPRVENDPAFPARTNVHWVSRIGEPRRVRHWERGAGETLACGSGACAVAVALTGGTPGRVPLALPGGVVEVTVADPLILSGPAISVFTGEFEL